MSGNGADTMDTPALLTRWQALGTVCLLLFGVAVAALQILGHAADGRAADDTEQLVRVQEVQASLLRADALATTAVLAGDGAPGQDAAYDAAVDAALTGITDAAEAQSEDREELATLNVAVNDYVAAVAESSGANALADASAGLRADALPVLSALVADNTERAEESMEARQPFASVGAGVLALVVLGWLHRRLSRTFRRHLNVGASVAVVVVALTTAGIATLGFEEAADNDDLRDGAFRTAVDQAAARTAANDAKASESLRLLRGGSGDSFEQAWQESAAVVSERGSEAIAGLWESYVEEHEQVVTRLEDGQRAAAVDIATAEDDGSTAALDAYDDAARAVTAEAAATVADELRGDRWINLVLAALVLVAAGGAVWLLGRGIGVRRREFA